MLDSQLVDELLYNFRRRGSERLGGIIDQFEVEGALFELCNQRTIIYAESEEYVPSSWPRLLTQKNSIFQIQV